MLVLNDLSTRLFQSLDPSIQFLAHTRLLGEEPNAPSLAPLRDEIRNSARVRALLDTCAPAGRTPPPAGQPYIGSHWVLSSLAEIGYPAGDPRLIPLREQVYEWLFSDIRERSIQKNHPVINLDGEVHACASVEGQALFYLITLGLADRRTEQLASRLIAWQWPEGGWNCVNDPQSLHWTFAEGLAALRGLSLYARTNGSRAAKRAVERAAEIFLSQNLFEVFPLPGVVSDSLLLHFPTYTRYDVLAGLVVMAEGGWISDPRCRPALEWLEKKERPEGGFPMEKKRYQTSDPARRGYSPVDWGPTGRRAANPFVTVQALGVLQAAGVAWLESAW